MTANSSSNKDFETAAIVLRQVASILGATGVGLGALGAHALHNKLVQRNMLEPWKTAILYQIFHASAVLGVSSYLLANSMDSNGGARNSSCTNNGRLVRAGQLMSVGSVLFSGSIYLLCFNIGPKKIVGPTTPIGGLLMLSGWIMLGVC